MNGRSEHTSSTRRSWSHPGRWLAALVVVFAPWPLPAQSSSADEPFSLVSLLPDAIVEPTVFGLAAWRLVVAALIVVVGFLGREFIFRKLAAPIRALFERTGTELDDLVLEQTRQPFSWLVWMVAVYIAVRTLDLPVDVEQSIDVTAKTLGILLAAWILFRVIDVGLYALQQFTRETESRVDNQLVPVVRRISRLCLFVLALLVVVQQWGYNVSSLIAGLGIGGLAFALAARNMLSNWFGALMIFTDRPFKIDDWVETEHGTGAIEEVGLRSTRIRTYERERIVVPNSEIASKAVTNLSVLDRRQISADIGLVYQTTHAQMTEILENIRTLLDEHEAIWDGDWRAFFVGFGDDALNIEISCFTEDPDLAHWRRVRQELFLEIIRIVEEAGTTFAYPTRSIFLEDSDGNDDGDVPRAGNRPRSPEADQ